MTDDFAADYRSLLGQLIGSFRAKGISPDEAADMAHETMLRTLVHLKRHGRERADLGPLVRTIARNLLVERVRKARPTMVPLSDATDVTDGEIDAFDHVLAAERRDAVRTAVRSLSPRHRHVVSLWMQGSSPTEIARHLGVKRNAVDAILHRARRNLATKLEGSGALGLVGVLGIRLRALGRRVSETLAALDPSGNIAPAGITLATIGLAAVISLGGPPSSAGRIPSLPTSTTVAEPSSTTPATKIGEDLRAQATTSVTSPIARRVKEYTVGAETSVIDPTTGEEREGWVVLTYDPDKNGKGPVDNLLEPVISMAEPR